MNFGENKDSRCIIFVSERATAKRLAKYLRERNVKETGEKVGYITSEHFFLLVIIKKKN